MYNKLILSLNQDFSEKPWWYWVVTQFPTLCLIADGHFHGIFSILSIVFSCSVRLWLNLSRYIYTFNDFKQQNMHIVCLQKTHVVLEDNSSNA